jgi:outer membrane protein TolC
MILLSSCEMLKSQLRLLLGSRQRATFYWPRPGTVGLCFGLFVGLIDLGLLLPMYAVEPDPGITASESADPAILVKELARLEAQITDQAKPVTLDEAISTGIRTNPQLLQAFSAIQQYEWQLIAAQRQWYPTIQLSNGTPFAGIQWTSFSQNYSSTSPTAPPAYSNNSRQSAFQPGLSISWNAIDLTRQPNINAASESLRQQKLLFDVSTRNLILNIQQSYFAIQSSRQLIDSFRRIYEINEQQLVMLEAQRSIGMTTVLDVEATRSQLFAQLNQLVGYTRAFIEQSASLAEAMALPEGVLATPSEPAGIRGDWDLPLQETVKQARRQREEILASLAAAEAARWSAIAAIRSYLPAFQLVGTGSLIANRGDQSYSYSGSSSETATSTRNQTASVGLGFTWSIFDGGIQAANAQSANAQARLQAAQAASTELQAMQEVRSSYGQLLTARVAFSSGQQAYRSAELAQRASRARFAVGVGDITSVVQTIQQLSEAAQQVSEATLSYNSALAQLYRYSATWPPLSQAEVQQQLQRLRLRPAPAAPSAKP